MKQYLINVGVALSILLAALLGGQYRQSTSADCSSQMEEGRAFNQLVVPRPSPLLGLMETLSQA